MKKLTLILSLLLVITTFIGCGSERVFPSSVEFSEAELAELQLGENEKSVKLYRAMPIIMKCLTYSSNVDEFYLTYAEENFPITDITIPVIFDKDGKIAKINDDEKSEYIKPQLENFYKALFEPQSVLDTVIKGEYTVERILCFHTYSGIRLSRPYTEEYWIQYDTNKGSFILFMPLSYYSQEEENGTMYLVPFKEVSRKTKEISSSIEPGLMGADLFYSSVCFEDYKFEYPS